MLTFLLVVQAIIGAVLVGVILMQQSEGGGLTSGGSPGGFVSARGAADFMTRTTAILAAIFVGLSIFQAVLATRGSPGGDIDTSLARRPVPTAPAPAAPLPVGTPAPGTTVPLANQPPVPMANQPAAPATRPVTQPATPRQVREPDPAPRVERAAPVTPPPVAPTTGTPTTGTAVPAPAPANSN